MEQYRIEITSIIVFVLISFLFIYLRLTKNYAKKLKNIVEVDQITGLMTVTKLVQEVKLALKTAKPNEYYLMSFDVDNFKFINQTYGFEKGNVLLRSIADSMRKYASEDALLCRYHNDIFLVFGKSKNITEFTIDMPMFSQERCDEIVKNVGINMTIHFSTSVYYIENPNDSIDYVSQRVRKARIAAKQKHGNTIIVYTEELRLKAEKETFIFNSMEQAIKDEEFFIFIQPKVELQTGKLVGGEVLVRWKKLDGTVIPPDEFIPLFENIHFITTLDKYVFEQTCKWIQSATVPLPCISVNISYVTALDEHFIKDYMNILNKYRLLPQQFELEITESGIADDFETMVIIMQRVKELGFNLAIDDFGKGASSLARLKELEVDVVKLDKGFITNNFNIKKGNLVIADVISLVNNLGIISLAEGIETQEQLDLLIGFGCNLGQGYFFDEPLSTQEFLDRVFEDRNKNYPKTIRTNEKIKGYLMDFEHLPYGIAIIKNDMYSTIIKANEVFYSIIGYTKQSLLEQHENRLTDIFIDKIYDVVKMQPITKDYTLEFDLRVRKADGKIVWVHDYVHYNAKEDLFFVTFVDTTDKMFLSEMELSFEAYQAQKESLIYLNNHTSEYVLISDIETGKIVYMNENAMKHFHYTKESEWKDELYDDVVFGSTGLVDESYYRPITEEFSHREYYNKFLKMHLYVENKIITVLGKKMRLNILTDVTIKKKMEYEHTLQMTLKQCIEYLYTTTAASTTATTTTFHNTLEQLRLYYNADRAYFYKFVQNGYDVERFYEVLGAGMKSAEGVFQAIPEQIKVPLLKFLAENQSIHQQTLAHVVDNLGVEFSDVYSKYQVDSFTYCAVMDTEGEIVGFMGVDNPKKSGENTELMLLLSRFIWMFIRNIHTKQLEKENYRLEELSKLTVLKKCTDNLKDMTYIAENITDILYSLRKHYGSNCARILSISEDMTSYCINYESYGGDIPSRMVDSQNKSISIISKWIERFRESEQSIVVSVDELHLSSTERKLWEENGVISSVATPMYDKNGVLSGILSVNNPTIASRSNALIHVVAKDISDYLEKIEIQKISELDALTGLNHKIITQEKIVALLEQGYEGVMFMIDIDHFKIINDTLGHSIGDNVLTDIAFKLEQTFRSDDIIGRIGGDEFMVFCPNLIVGDLIKMKAQSLLNSCQRVYKNGDLTVQVSISIGICNVDKECNTFTRLYEKVDSALYEAKRNGRNQFSILK